MKTAPVIELSSLANAGPFILLDVREKGAFDAAHSAGAVRVPIEVWEAAAKTDETSLENVGYWASEIGKLGVTQELL